MTDETTAGPFPKTETELFGVVLSTTRRYAEIALQGQEPILAKPATGNMDLAVGDQVRLEVIQTEAIISEHLPRTNELLRSYDRKRKLLAANIKRLFIVVQPLPLLNLTFLDRVLCAATLNKIPTSIVLNKCDLEEHLPETLTLLRHYQSLNLPLLQTSVLKDIGLTELNSAVFSENSGLITLTGVSGVGKSSIISKILPETKIRIQEVAKKGMGKQTTSQARAYLVEPNIAPGLLLLDLPGIQNYGLCHLEIRQVISGFPDLNQLAMKCVFSSCAHQDEQGCAVRAAIESQELPKHRLDSYRNILQEIKLFNPYGPVA